VIFCRRPTYAVRTGDRDRENACHRPLLTKQFGTATKPFSWLGENVLKP
jgi:hypothetical protein